MKYITGRVVAIVLVVLAPFIYVILGQLFGVRGKDNNVNTPVIVSASAVYIPYPAEFNYRQTINDCAPFAAAAAVRAVTGQNVSSTEFAQEISWRLPNKYTLPPGLEALLRQKGFHVDILNIGSASDEEKIISLQYEISSMNPIILLGERDGYQHYITLLGYNQEKKEFYVYDSFYDKDVPGMTIDSNGDLPGNRIYSHDELLTFWRGGGMYGLYEWYAIAVSRQETE